MKKIGFLSFGHWSPSPQSQTRSAADALLQSIELAVAAEELGADGAYFRVHHFARQLASPFPLLAAVGARTSRIEIGTAVIDMRYENPLYMAEDAGAADLIAGGRLQLGISRGSPEQVIDGWRYFGYQPAEGESDADMGRRHAEVFLDVLTRRGLRPAQSAADVPQSAGPAARSSRIPRVCASGSGGAPAPTPPRSGRRKLGMNLQSSTLKNDETGEPFHVQQAAQIRAYREAWTGGRPYARAARLGQPQHLRAGRRSRPRLFRPRSGRTRTRSAIIDEKHPGDLRPQLRRRAGRADRAAQAGRGDRRGRHAAADRAEPARRRLQRPCHRGDPDPRRAGARLALIASLLRSADDVA